MRETIKTKARWPVLAAFLCFALVACGSGTDNDPTGRTWELTELEGSSLVEGTAIDLTITDDGVAGSSGCNNYTGTASLDIEDGALTFGPDLASTMMACDQPIMDQEQKYLDALARVTSYQMASEELLLKDSNDIVVAAFD